MPSVLRGFARKAIFVSLLSLSGVTALHAQRRFHFDMDYHHDFGFALKVKDARFTKNDNHPQGNSFSLGARYDITPQWSAGMVVSAAGNTKGNMMLPVYATVRYKPFLYFSDFYAFTKVGYTFKLEDIKGFTGIWGVGYAHMFRKNFGINLQLGYHLSQFKDVPVFSIVTASENSLFINRTSVKSMMVHSVRVGFGFTF